MEIDQATPYESSDADLIFKLQEKLEALKSQVHQWKAKAKGMPQLLRTLKIERQLINGQVCHVFQFSSKRATTILTISQRILLLHPKNGPINPSWANRLGPH